MFKLVGEDTFDIDQARCIIRVDPAPGFKYEYSLYIDGKPHAQYTEELTRQYRLWLCTCGSGSGGGGSEQAGSTDASQEYRIMLKLDTLSLYVNDELREETVSEPDAGRKTRLPINHVSPRFTLCRPSLWRAAPTPASCCRTHHLYCRHAPAATNTTASFTHCSLTGCPCRKQRYSKSCRNPSPYCKLTEVS